MSPVPETLQKTGKEGRELPKEQGDPGSLQHAIKACPEAPASTLLSGKALVVR